MIAFDATALALLINPSALPPLDPSTQQPVVDAKGRYELLASKIQSSKQTIIIPTPALAEVLVKAGDDAGAFIQRIDRTACFKVADFDFRAAMEVAAMTRAAIRRGDKRDGSAEPYQKIKVDRQILAIARVANAECIYSDDQNMFAFASLLGLKVVRTWELPSPPLPDPSLFDEPGEPAWIRKEKG